jgi:preprotein translocase subunit SecG
MTFLLYLIVTLFIIVSVIMMLLVLIQKGRGGGLASAFGGGGAGNTAFGSKTGDVLTWATSIVFGVFLLLAIAANLIFNNWKPGPAPVIAVPAPPPAAPANTGVGDGQFTPPGAPGSSLPKAPETADPGVTKSPPAPGAAGAANPPEPTTR